MELNYIFKTFLSDRGRERWRTSV